jgi:iron(III) transport system substrate-binding protein
MKKALALVLALTMLLAFAACGSDKPLPTDAVDPSAATVAPETSAPAETGGTLVVYTPNSDGLIAATIPQFEEKYGITVELVTGGTGDLLTQIKEEAANPYADVMWGGSYSKFTSMQDYFQDYVSANDGLLNEDARNTLGYTTCYVYDGSGAIIVNTDKLAELGIDEITGYADLLNPKLKGNIVSANCGESSSAFAQLTNMLLDMASADAANPYEDDAAWQYVTDLFSNGVVVVESSSSVYKTVADGEYAVGLSYEDPVAALIKDGAANIKMVYPKEGMVYLCATAAIVKNCKNVDNAKLFMDYITSEECQNRYATETTNRPVLMGASSSDWLPAYEDIYVVFEDTDYVNSHKADIQTRFNDMFTSLG